MTDELNFIRDLLNVHRCTRIPRKTLKGADSEFNSLMDKHVARTKDIIVKKVYGWKNQEDFIQKYVDLLQMALIEFDNQLVTLTRPFPRLSITIADLIEFLLTTYKRYFNFSATIPACIRQKRLLETDHKIGVILLVFESSTAEPELLLIMSEYLLQKTDVIDSFTQVLYFQIFVNAIHKVCMSISDDDLENSLLEELVYINFNTRHFTKYIGDVYNKRFSQLANNQLLELEIVKYTKRVERFSAHQDFAYDIRSSSVKDTMKKILKIELKFLLKIRGIDPSA